MADITASIWMHWHGHPEVILGLIITESLYLVGIGPLRIRLNLSDKTNPYQLFLFTLGILIILISLTSPLHILSDQYLFSAHMLQHILITLIAPPLLLLGMPQWLIDYLLSNNVIYKIMRFIVHPIIAIVIFNLIFSLWHIPELYKLSVSNHLIHIGEHLMFIISSLVMWWVIYSTSKKLPKISYPLQMIYLFTMSLAQIIVFGIITFAPEPIYAHYVDAPRIWNISALLDQQIGGIIMKVGSGFLFLAIIIFTFFKWFDSESKDTKRVILEEDLD